MKAIPEQTIAHYRILEPLGAGGMGAVYKAYDKKLQRVVAIKLLKPEYVSHQDRRRRFFQEARAASALNHPHILTVYDVGEDEDGTPYIAMEYVEGETLRQKIKARAFQLKENLEIAIQIAEGLAKAHEAGIIHRDLKPENLMIRQDGYAKILDFGLAKLIAQRERAFVADSEQKTLLRVDTESGTMMGTVNYMSPEQLLGQRVDRRCDIFSFGVVLCEMLTGSCPFVNQNRIDTMHAILHGEPRMLDANRAELPSELQRILGKALAKAPKDRYQSVTELATELSVFKRNFELGKVVPAATKKQTGPCTDHVSLSCRSNRLRQRAQRISIQSSDDHRRSAADRCRRRYRKDTHSGLSRRSFGGDRSPPRVSAAPDIHPASCHQHAGARSFVGRRSLPARLGRHFSFAGPFSSTKVLRAIRC